MSTSRLLLSLSLFLSLFLLPSLLSQPFSSLPLWGTFRPGLYFGVRARSPHSPLLSLGWSLASLSSLDHLRIDAEERNEVTRYGFTVHDAFHLAQESIKDEKVGIELKCNFMPLQQEEGFYVHIHLSALKKDKDVQKPVMLFLALSLPAKDRDVPLSAHIHHSEANDGTEFNNVHITEASWSTDMGSHTLITRSQQETTESISFPPSVPNWFILNKDGPTQVPVNGQPRIVTLFLPADNEWDVKPAILSALTQSAQRQFQVALKQLQNTAAHMALTEEEKSQEAQRFAQHMRQEIVPVFVPQSGDVSHNVMLVQWLLQSPAQLDLLLLPTTHRNDNIQQLIKYMDNLRVKEERLIVLSNQELVDAFPVKSPFNTSSHRQLAVSAASDLLSGLGYFHGTSIAEIESIVPATKKEPARKKMEKRIMNETTLLTTTPSRAMFPRGFLWDEGFHQLVTSHFSLPLALDIMDSWLRLIKPSGWLPREQILGNEARKRVPTEFQPQRLNIANPPTLVLALGRFVQRALDDLDEQQVNVVIEESGRTSASDMGNDRNDIKLLSVFLTTHLDALDRHADWYFKTQSSTPIDKSEAHPARSLTSSQSFRWAGRSLGHCLSSGLDDYPRAPWIPRRADGLLNHTQVAGVSEGVEGHVDLHSWMIALTRTLALLHSFVVRFAATTLGDSLAQAAHSMKSEQYQAKSEQLLQSLDALHWSSQHSLYCDYAYRKGVRHFECHVGYVAFVPFMLGHIDPASKHFKLLLDQLLDPVGIWSPFGVKSLSRQDALHASSENYWRGAIWFNINYLLTQALGWYRALMTQANDSDEPNKSFLSELMSAVGLTSSQQRHVPHFNSMHVNLCSHTSPRLILGSSNNISRSLEIAVSSAYEDLRRILIGTVNTAFHNQGFLFEQYNDTTGRGQRSHPFTGWTALVVNLMTEHY